MMNYGRYYMFPQNHFFIGGIVEFLFWVLIAAFLVGLIAHLFSKNENSDYNNNGSDSEDSAISLLKKRYAKGEITKKEFDQIKKDIE